MLIALKAISFSVLLFALTGASPVRDFFGRNSQESGTKAAHRGALQVGQAGRGALRLRRHGDPRALSGPDRLFRPVGATRLASASAISLRLLSMP